MENYYRLGALRQQQQAGQQNMQSGAIDLQMKQRALKDQQTIMDTLSQSDGDVEKALPKLAGKITPGAFKDLANFHLDTKYKLSQIADNDLKVQQDQHDRTGQLFDYASKLSDDQLAQQWPTIAQRNNEINPQHPLDPNQPIPKAQLPSLGVGLQTQEQYLKQEQARREQQTAVTEQQKNSAQANEANARADEARANSGMLTPDKAASILANPNADPRLQTRAQKFQQIQLQQDRQKKQIEADIQSGDPNVLGDNLAHGLMAPSQMPKRGAIWVQAMNAANRISQRETGQPFNAAKAEAQYAKAHNVQTQGVLDMIDAMNEPGGSIAIAENAAKLLPRFDSQTANSVFNVFATQFGSNEASNFHTAMLGLADEYSKVMGGGVSSDTGRQQGLDLLKAAYSKGQLSGAVTIMRQDIAARKKAIVRDNAALRSMYPDQGGSLGKSTASDPLGIR